MHEQFHLSILNWKKKSNILEKAFISHFLFIAMSSSFHLNVIKLQQTKSANNCLHWKNISILNLIHILILNIHNSVITLSFVWFILQTDSQLRETKLLCTKNENCHFFNNSPDGLLKCYIVFQFSDLMKCSSNIFVISPSQYCFNPFSSIMLWQFQQKQIFQFDTLCIKYVYKEKLASISETSKFCDSFELHRRVVNTKNLNVSRNVKNYHIQSKVVEFLFTNLFRITNTV